MATATETYIPTAEPIYDPAAEDSAMGGRGGGGGMGMGSDDGGGFESTSQGQNIGLAVLKRWPWLLVGIVGGLVLGLLYHTQQSPTYQSNAQLLVIKNRPELMTGAGGNTSMTFVEDYVTTQVTLLRSEMILLIAARKMQESQFQIKPPSSDRDRVNFMMSRFTVMRERETGSAQPTNVLGIAFRSGNPGDSALYLRAIIDAYREQLASLYAEATITQEKNVQRDIDTLTNDINELYQHPEKGINKFSQDIMLITREDLTSMRSRLTLNINDKQQKKLKLTVIDKQLEDIQKIGDNPIARQELLRRTPGYVPRQANITSLDSKNPQDVLFSFELQRQELSTKFGKDHPEMQALDGRIRMLKGFLERQGGGMKEKLLDDLSIHEITLMQDKRILENQISTITDQISEDEQKIDAVSKLTVQRDDRLKTLERVNQALEMKRSELKMLQNSRSTTGGYKVEDITKPTEGAQVSPILYRSILFGLFLGLVAGGGLALSMELTDRSFRTPAEIQRRLGLRIFGHIPRLKVDEPTERNSTAGIESSLISFYRPSSTEAEAYRGVRTQLYFSTQGRGHQVIQVTSPNPGDGKSTLAANLAISIAQSGKRVVLIDCDFRKPRVHKIFKLPKPELGLATVMSGEAKLSTAVQSCEIENLSLMPCGPRPANPAELLTAPKFSEVLRELRESFDFVIVDTPPVLAVSDPSVVAPRVDGVLLVFRMTKNARPVTERAREQLGAVGARMLGVVVNASSARSGGYGGYGYAYQYEYQYAESYADQE